MGIFRQFPYSNFHDMNMDQIIKIMREMQDEWTATKAEWHDLEDFVNNYFNNLDVSAEVLAALRLFASDGTLADIMDPTIASTTTAWLNAHITPTSPIVDDSLSIEGAAADAKATGAAIENVKNFIELDTHSDYIDFTARYVIALNGGVGNAVDLTPSANNCYYYDIVNCEYGDVFVINGTGGGMPRLWGFIDENNILLEVSATGLTGNNLMLFAPKQAAKLVLNSETPRLGINIKNPLYHRIDNLESSENRYSVSGDVTEVLKELYVEDLKGHEITGIDLWYGSYSSTYRYYFSEIRLFFDNNANSYIRCAFVIDQDLISEDYSASQNLVKYSSAPGAQYLIDALSNTVVSFSGSISGDIISGYMIFNTVGAATGRTRYQFKLNDVTNILMSPVIYSYLNNKNICTEIMERPVEYALGDGVQASNQFKADSPVKVYADGLLVDPDDYTEYKQGKIVFNSDAYDDADILLNYLKHTEKQKDINQPLEDNRFGFRVHLDSAGEDPFDFVPDPVTNDRNVLKISSNTIIEDSRLIRVQFDRENTHLTECVQEIDVYIPRLLKQALISFNDVVHWFAIAGGWCPYGSSTRAVTNMYSGQGTAIQLYKVNADDTNLKYQIMNRKRTIVSGVEQYEVLSSVVSDFEVKADEWVHFKLELKEGNPGKCKLTITDSDGIHVLEPQRDGEAHAYIGNPTPEADAAIYGPAMIPDVPYNTFSELNMFKLYTSSDVANHVINTTGDISIYFKNYKCYDAITVNA